MNNFEYGRQMAKNAIGALRGQTLSSPDLANTKVIPAPQPASEAFSLKKMLPKMPSVKPMDFFTNPAKLFPNSPGAEPPTDEPSSIGGIYPTPPDPTADAPRAARVVAPPKPKTVVDTNRMDMLATHLENKSRAGGVGGEEVKILSERGLDRRQAAEVLKHPILRWMMPQNVLKARAGNWIDEESLRREFGVGNGVEARRKYGDDYADAMRRDTARQREEREASRPLNARYIQ